MSNQVFQQNLDDKKGPQPGGPYLIQMLFKEPVPMPDKENMTAVMEKHIGAVECFCHDKKTAGFAALEHIAEFQDGKVPGAAHGDEVRQVSRAKASMSFS